MYYNRAMAGKGGARQVAQTPGKILRGNSGQIQLGKDVARKMIALRLSGWTKEQCDEWLEGVCQQVEAMEQTIRERHEER